MKKKFWGKKVSDPYIRENVKKKFLEKFWEFGYNDYYIFILKVLYENKINRK